MATPVATTDVTRLLPVIRFVSEVHRSFGAPGPLNVAIYPQEIVLFHERERHIFPEAAYQPNGVDAFLKSRAYEDKPVRIPLAEIKEATLTHPIWGAASTGVLKTAGARYSFSVKTDECRHVQMALEQSLGSRLTVKGSVADRHRVRGRITTPTAVAPKREATASKPPLYSKSKARLLRLVAAPATMAIAVVIILGALTLTNDEAERAVSAILGVVLGLAFGRWCLERAYRLGLTPAADLLASDPRPPVLYLRSFKDDGQNNLHPASQVAELFGLKNPRIGSHTDPVATILLPFVKVFCYILRIGKVINLWRGVRTSTAEEQFSGYFSRMGPFIAIGRPGETLARGGAARLYVGHDEWQQAVAELVPRCQAIVLQPEETEGVWWEILHIVQRARPEKVLLCLVNYAGNQQRYEEFRLKFEDTTGIALPRMIGRYMFLYFGPHWEPRLVESRYRSEFVWPWVGQAIDFERTLAPFVRHTEPPPFSEKDRRFSGVGWLAVTSYFILSAALYMGPIILVVLLRTPS